MKNIIIIGTGGFASELTEMIEDKDFGTDVLLKGYLSTDSSGIVNWEKYNYEKPYLGFLKDYKYEFDDNFVIAIGNPASRQTIINEIIKKNGNFLTLIHPLAKVSKSAKIGIGNIIEPFCIIGPLVIIGNFNTLTSQSIVSHDSTIGNNNFFATTLLCGNTKVGDNNNFGIRCTTVPGITIGNDNIIKAGMLIDKNVCDEETVFYKYKERIVAIPK